MIRRREFRYPSWVRLIPFVIIGLIFLFIINKYLRIRKVDCQLESGKCNGELQQKVEGVVVNQSIVFADTQKLAGDLKGEPLFLKEVEVKKIIPDKVEVVIKDRFPIALVQPVNATDYYPIDEDGVLLDKVVDNKLPLIVVDGLTLPKKGEKFKEEAVLKALAVIVGLKLNLYQPEKAVLTSEWTIEVYLREGTVIVFSTKKEVDEQLDSLQLIFSRAKIEGKRIARLDLRFNKPVVIYSKN